MPKVKGCHNFVCSRCEGHVSPNERRRSAGIVDDYYLCDKCFDMLSSIKPIKMLFEPPEESVYAKFQRISGKRRSACVL